MSWLRGLFAGEDPPVSGISSGTDPSLFPSAAAPHGSGANGGRHQVGTIVEYNSASQGAWIPARVVGLNPDGSYDLDCKPAVPPEKIRAATGTFTSIPATTDALPSGPLPPARQEFELGALVEYFSESQGGWILAKVLAYDSVTGVYNLDCKPGVPPSKMRRAPPSSDGLGAATRPSPTPGTRLAPSAAPPERPTESGLSAALPQTPSMVDLPPSAVAPPAAHTPLKTAPAPAISASQGAPVQLVSVARRGDKWHFEVNEEAARVLEAYGKRPVAVCTVCGPYRTGKSYLLNLLLGRIQKGNSQFRVGSTSRACTEGLWMWGAGDSFGGDGSALIFMDCEGFGSTESDKTRDAKLMSLCMLLSSVFLLNTKGVLNEGLLNALSLVCHLAEHMEENGQEASKPALLWLLRDFVLQLEDDSGRPLSPDEYLERQLRQRPLAGADAERSRAAVEVREHLLRFFPQRHCATLVQPIIEESQLLRLAEVPYAELRGEFRAQFEAMQVQLLSMARMRPKTVGGQTLGGAALAALLRKLVEGLNSNQALNVRSAWDMVQHTALQSLCDELRSTVASQLQRIVQGAPLPIPGSPKLPVSDDTIAKVIGEARRSMEQEWNTRALGDTSIREEYWDDLRSTFAREEEALRAENGRLAEGLLREAGAEWEMWLMAEGEASIDDPRSETLANLLDRGLPAKPAARVAREALGAARMARIRWDGIVSGLRSEKQLLESELSSNKLNTAASNSVSDSTLEQIGEAGRLKGQVEALQRQAREAAETEKTLRQKAFDAQEELRKQKRAHSDALELCETRKLEVSALERKVHDLQQQQQDAAAGQPSANAASSTAPAGPADAAKPKCCVVM